MSDKITRNDIIKNLSSELRDVIRINVTAVCDSTNTAVKMLAQKGENEGFLMIAEAQTGGRGRLGRSFFSPEGTGIYMSLLLRPSVSPEEVTLITPAAAVAVCKALEKITSNALKPQIKWVNDIYLNGKKVCGILTEGSFKNSNETDYAVLGLGINFYEPKKGFPQELSNIAGAVFENEKIGLKCEFIAEFINEFFQIYKNLRRRAFLDDYRKRCFVIGKKVTAVSGDEAITVTPVFVDDNCGLCVRLENGEMQTLTTGEISLKFL